MTPEQDRSGAHADRPFRPTRGQRIVAAGFLGAFSLTILTVLLTGLWVRAPRSRAPAPPVPPAAQRVDIAPQFPEPPAQREADDAAQRSATDAAGERLEHENGSETTGAPDGVR